MELYEAMSTLRAVRRLKPDPVPAEVLDRVLAAASWAPTGGNLQPWRVVLVSADAPKRELGVWYQASWTAFSAGYKQRVAAAPEAERAREQRMLAAADHLAEHFHAVPVIAVFCFNPQLMAITDSALDRVSVVGGASIYTAVQNFLLAARAEGLGCVLTTLLCEHEPKVKALLGIPDPWGTAAAVPLGYPVGRGHGPLRRRPPAALAYAERWGERRT